jgi:hypothetical protein
MTQASLRVCIFFLWLGFFGVSIVILALSSWLRSDIETLDFTPAISIISIIWIPAISCLVGFWFPERGNANATSIRVSREKTVAALVITVGYLLLVLYLIVHSTFLVKANTEASDAGSVTLLGQLIESAKVALHFSFIPLLPISWLTAGGSNNTDKTEIVSHPSE